MNRLPPMQVGTGAGLTLSAGYDWTPPFALFPSLLGGAAGWALGNYFWKGPSSRGELPSRLALAAAGAYGLNFVVANSGPSA